MASELTAAVLAELKRAVNAIPWHPCDPYTGWFSDQNLQRLDGDRIKRAVCFIVNHAPALIAAAERVEVAERQKRIACGVANELGDRLRKAGKEPRT